MEFADLKDSHKDESCLIIGNGPSLTPGFLESLRGAKLFSFAANGFCHIFEQTDYRPDAVCMSNHDAVVKYGDQYPEETLKFYKSGARELLGNETKNLFELPFPCQHDLGGHIGPFIKDGNFTLDPSKENFCGDTVLLDFAIPVAFYLGFAEFYLCGVDCDYAKGYFDDKYQVAAKDNFKGMVHGDYSIAIPAYRYVQEFLQGRGRRVYRLTASEKLDFIESRNAADFHAKEK